MRVIERLQYLNSRCENCSHKEQQQDADIEDGEILSSDEDGQFSFDSAHQEQDLSRLEADQFTLGVQNTLKHLENSFKSEEIAAWLNTPDEHGVCLIHLLTALNQHELVALIIKHGAEINKKVDNTNYTPLIISAAHGFDPMSRTLIKLGAKLVEPSPVKEAPRPHFAIPKSQSTTPRASLFNKL